MAGLRQLLAFTITLALTASPQVSATVYKTVDDMGNIIYTDKESEQAESIEIRPIQTIPAPTLHQNSKPKTSKKKGHFYTSVTIISPSEQETFRNPEDIMVSVKVDPALGPGHRYRLLVNGQKQKESSAPNFVVKHPERGTLVLKAEIIDAHGKVLVNSEPRTVFVHKASILFRAPDQPDDSKNKS